LPPLRDRKGDILLLAESFLKRFSERQQRPVLSIESDAIQAMMCYSWPGNIRELESTIERAVLITDHDKVMLQDLPLTIRECAEQYQQLQPMYDLKDFFDPAKNQQVLPLEQLKQLAVRHALEACEGNISEAAVKLDISRSTLYRLLEIYNIKFDRPMESENAQLKAA